jgi:lysozyme
MLRRPWIKLVPVVSLVASACGGAPDGSSGNAEKVGWTSEPVTVCPAGSTVEGIDVSEFQGSIDWNAVHGSGRGFAIARVSDGTGHSDPTFQTNWSGIKAAGMVRGVYQFFRASEDPTAQADLLVNAIGALGPDDLPPVADVEVTDGVSGGTLVANLATWTARIKSKTGVTPMIYTAPGFWDPLPSTNQFGGDVLWVANWQVNCPDTPTPWGGWRFWQYADNGNVPGIGGAVDLDKFNGTLAQLQQQAQGAAYGASYVGQSFPLASMPLQMVAGQTIPSYIELKNIGTKAWDSKTRLGTTQPRDRVSAFADASWIATNRPAGVTGSVAPGATYKFQFDLHAPDKAGTYYEYFGVLEEGVAWFSDSGQGGPPDNDLEVQIQVIDPEYRGTFKDQSFPLAPMAQMVHAGDAVDGWIELTNTGTKPWKAGETKLAPTPRDKPSGLADPSWLSPTRVSTVAADVAPGAVGRFPVKLDVARVGDYTQTFGLVEETVTWFADPLLGGGPADDLLKVHIVALPPGAPLDAGVGNGGDGGAGGDSDGGWANANSGGGGGCSASGGGQTGGTPWAMAIAAVAAVVSVARRRRRGRSG